MLLTHNTVTTLSTSTLLNRLKVPSSPTKIYNVLLLILTILITMMVIKVRVKEQSRLHNEGKYLIRKSYSKSVSMKILKLDVILTVKVGNKFISQINKLL